MNKILLKEVVIDQYNINKNKNYILRDNYDLIKQNYGNDFIIIISGMRRVGKSSLFEIIKKDFPVNYYLNFDDERLLNFNLEDFSNLYDIYLELYGIGGVFFFDEIQNIKGWERFVRRLHNEGKKVFITGSNANLLSQELGTHLTGRYIQFEMYPFSFNEYLKLYNISIFKNNIYIKENKAILKNYFDNYIITGGLPEYIISNELNYLKTIYDSIIYKDIIARYGLTKNIKIIKELLKYLYSNIAKEYSYNNLKNMLGLSNAITVKEYINYFENSYLLFSINKFDYSFKKQLLTPKKIYSIDVGFSSSISFELSKNNGQKLENVVFIELKRRGYEIYYHKVKKECDFLLQDRGKIVGAIQVTFDMSDLDTQNREINGLLETMNIYKLNEGLILTYDQEEIIQKEDKIIKVIPVWKWMLGV